MVSKLVIVELAFASITGIVTAIARIIVDAFDERTKV